MPYLRKLADGANDSDPELPLADRVLAFLAARNEPAGAQVVRDAMRVRKQSVVDVLRELESQERVNRVDRGWRLADR